MIPGGTAETAEVMNATEKDESRISVISPTAGMRTPAV